MQSISIEAVVMIVIAIVGATIYIVNSINGVRDAVKDLGVELRNDIDNHEERITDLEEKVDGK